MKIIQVRLPVIEKIFRVKNVMLLDMQPAIIMIITKEKYKKVNLCPAAHFVECLSQMKMVGHRHGSIEDCSFYDFSLEWMAN